VLNFVQIKNALEILKQIPKANSPDGVLIILEGDKEVLMKYFNCNEKMLKHRIWGWQQCSENF
jgi:hypothetical protein